MSAYDLPLLPQSDAGAPTAAARAEREHRTDGEAGASAPRLVTTGGKFTPTTPHDPESSESLHVLRRPDGSAQGVWIPQPKPDGRPDAAITDYLNCTFPFQAERLDAWCRRLQQVLGAAFFPVKQRRGGLHGYQHSYNLGESGAMFAHGGQSGTALLSLPGAACAQVPDWICLVAWLRDELDARITRWDGAADDYAGEHALEWAVAQYQAGQFNCGGNKPRMNQAGNWIEPDGTGRTLYIGRRKHGKLLRVYEKGRQLGDPASPWVRWEIELHNRDRIIPWDVLLQPGCYVAGAYPSLAWVECDASRIATTQHAFRIGYERLVHYARQSYGKLIDVMLDMEGSAEAVVAKLRQPGMPSRLDYLGLPGQSHLLPGEHA